MKLNNDPIKYSAHADEQLAFDESLRALRQVGAILLDRPRGTLARISDWKYVLVYLDRFHKRYDVVCLHYYDVGEPINDLCALHWRDICGTDAEDLRELALTMQQWAESPVFEQTDASLVDNFEDECEKLHAEFCSHSQARATE